MNKPVAWIHELVEIPFDGYQITVAPSKDDYYTIPLYTAEQFHPVKELLAKDILDVYQSREWYEDFDGELWFNWLKFADAILRKAQEK